MVIERLHGGDYESFLAYLARATRGARTFGWIALGAGLLVELVWMVVRLLPRLAYLRRAGALQV